MTGLLNRNRPPAFCPGCSHDKVVQALDRALLILGLAANRVVIVSDIGCSGLFDTFFKTHAFHGLHGRALTYATGLKLARPELTVIAVMGDGGLGIGGAHLLSACRRNLDLTLLVLNNFNYGMTGGQFSATTPTGAQTASGFLNQMEMPLDLCQLAEAAGAPYAARVSADRKDLSEEIEKALSHKGFSVVDIWGLCPGRYLKRNQWTVKQMEAELASRQGAGGVINRNVRDEYADQYFKQAEKQSAAGPVPSPVLSIELQFKPSFSGRREVLILGAAGQRIHTAGEILCLAAVTAGLHATQKNDYPITVLRGHSISELVLSNRPVDYTGLYAPSVVIALSAAGVTRRQELFPSFEPSATVIKAEGVDIPATPAKVVGLDFKARSIHHAQWALAALAVLARSRSIITSEMLKAAIEYRFEGMQRDQALSIISMIRP